MQTVYVVLKKCIKIPQFSSVLNFIVGSNFVLGEKLIICRKPFEKSLIISVYNFYGWKYLWTVIENYLNIYFY